MSGAPFKLDPGRLEEKFSDKLPPYSKGEADAEATRCLYCVDAPCIKACPTAIDIPTFIRKIGTGNTSGSARTILDANLLGASCSRVCPVEVLCEGSCVYVGWGRTPISIGRLQRYAMDNAASTSLLEKAPRSGKSIGLIGAGPASLACAGKLALLGHDAVIYEKRALPGGLNTTGVAPYKMPATRALEEVAFIQELGVEIKTGVEVGKDVTVDELFDRHDHLFLGIGLGPDSRLGAPGEDGEGVIGAVEWIEKMKNDGKASVDGLTSVAVIGGGNTAIDVVRELRALGVPRVHMVYRRSESEMSGYQHEWAGARAERGMMIENAIVSEVTCVDGKATALQLVHADGGRATEEALDPLPVDLVVLAIGQSKLREIAVLFPDVEVNDRGCIVCDASTGATGNKRVFAGGDAANGGKEVVNAVDEGQKAAVAIDACLRGGELNHA